MLDLDADLPAFYADFGITLNHQPVSGPARDVLVLLDKPGTTLFNGEVIATDYLLRYRIGSTADVKREDIFVNPLDVSERYRAREAALAHGIDGREKVVSLSKVSA